MIVIKYPPDFDGELHIKVENADSWGYTYTFTHTSRSGKLSEWEALVEACKGVLNQDKRIRSKERRP